MKNTGLKYFLLNGYEEYNNSVMRGGAAVSPLSPVEQIKDKLATAMNEINIKQIVEQNSLETLVKAGVDVTHIKELKPSVDITDLLRVEYSRSDIIRARFPASELKAAGFSASELKMGGYSAEELYNAGYTTAQELYDAGYYSDHILNAGVDFYELREVNKNIDHFQLVNIKDYTDIPNDPRVPDKLLLLTRFIKAKYSPEFIIARGYNADIINKIFEKIQYINTSSTNAVFKRTLVRALESDYTEQELMYGIGMTAGT